MAFQSRVLAEIRGLDPVADLLRTAMTHPTYPTGYEIETLGP